MKKGQGLGINTIVVAALALVILIILIMVFRTQIQKGTQKYLDIGETAEEDIKSKSKCATLFSGRECFSDPCPEKGYIPIPGDWSDCKDSGKPNCCERINV